MLFILSFLSTHPTETKNSKKKAEITNNIKKTRKIPSKLKERVSRKFRLEKNLKFVDFFIDYEII